MKRKQLIMACTGLILSLLMAVNSSLAQEFSQMGNIDHFLIDEDLSLLNSQNSFSNLINVEKQLSRNLSPQDNFISYQESQGNNLLITHPKQSAKLAYQLNAKDLSLETRNNTGLNLANDSVIYKGTELPSIHANLYLKKDSDPSVRLVSGEDRNIDLFDTSTFEDQIVLSWTEISSRGYVIKGCLINDNSCQESILYEAETGVSVLELQLSENQLVWLLNKNDQLSFQNCELSLNSSSQLILEPLSCQELKNVDPEAKLKEIRNIYFQQGRLIFSQLIKDVFEIRSINLKSDPTAITNITVNSEANQINPTSVVDIRDNQFISWEDHQTSEVEIKMAILNPQLRHLAPLNIRASNPLLSLRSSQSDSCHDNLELTVWNEETNSLEIYRPTSSAATISTKLLEFDQVSEYFELKLNGQLNLDNLLVNWRADKDQEWQTASSKLSEEGISVHIPESLSTVQLQVKFDEEIPQCLSSLEITQGGNLTDIEKEISEKIVLSPDQLAKLQSMMAKETSLDTELYAQIKLLQILNEEQLSSSAISFDNIQVRSSHPSLDKISGTAPDRNQEIWFYLVNGSQESILLGNTTVGPNREFSFEVPRIPPEYSSEIFLIATQVPDIRLAPFIKSKTTIIPIYLYRLESLISSSKQRFLDLEITSIEFKENGTVLETLNSDFLEVYKKSNDTNLELNIEGTVYADSYENISLNSQILPLSLENEHQLDEKEVKNFSGAIEITSTEFEQLYQLILQATDEEQKLISEYSLSFKVLDQKDFPSLLSVIWKASLSNLSILALLLILIITIVIFISNRKNFRRSLKFASILIILIELSLLSYKVGTQSLALMFSRGMIMIPGQELIIQKKSASEIPALTLTSLNENLEVVPALSSSWSNISPNIWEFILRQDKIKPGEKLISIQEIINSIKTIIDEEASEQQYLSSIKQIIGVNEERIQFVTHFPDPLLPQKLTKIEIKDVQDPELIAQNTRLYLPLEEFVDHSRYKLNSNYFGLPFLENLSVYQTELIRNNKDDLKDNIKLQEIDIFDEPDPSIWPALFQNNYKILPKINTGSLILLINHKSFISKNPSFIAALQKILQSPRILQTSYFQYGRLADQFAPPGVVGYHPKIEAKEETRSSQEMLQAVKNELQISELTQKLHFPSQELRLAQAIEQELEREGINVIPVEIATEDFEEALLENLPDLILVALDFDLGDMGPFLDSLIDSNSPFNSYYSNALVDDLIEKSRSELNTFRRLELLHNIAQITVVDDPAAIPLLFKKSFVARKKPAPLSTIDSWLQRLVFGWSN